jgi:hydrogenase assembly chaperone HypC/HupF
MCLPDAGRVLDVAGDEAVVEVRGARRRIPIIVLTAAGQIVHTDDWLLVHTGLAVAIISAAEAADINAVHTQGAGHAG